MPKSIIPDGKIFLVEFVRMWSIREELLHVTCVGQVINCFKENILDKILDIYLSRYVLVFDRQSFLFYLKYNFHFVEH